MSLQKPAKTADANRPKINPAKPGIDQGKIINQLRQEIRILNHTIKKLQQKPDLQAINIAIPRNLLSKVKQFVLNYEKDVGVLIDMSDLFCDAMDVYLWAEQENELMEKERNQAESTNGQKR